VTNDLSYSVRPGRTFCDEPAGRNATARSAPIGQGGMVLTLMAAVSLVDQATKWWAWRHVRWTVINPGGDAITGQRIATWYADRATGALLDLMSVALASCVVYCLARCRLHPAVWVLGALTAGGWGSNLLDRLGTHYWTAPGSVRGAVDFIHLDGAYYNIADFFIIFGTPLCALAILYQLTQSVRGRRAVSAAPPKRSPIGVRVPALAGAVLVLAVTVGATHYGKATAASCSSIPPAGPYAGVSALDC
jgi:lipoprotein signal peptidase